MADELQSLLDKINTDGVQKANAEREAILARAKEEAARIVADARSEAEKLRADAKAEAEKLQNRAESAIQQAARDTVLKLRSELEARISAAVENAAENAMTPQFMAELIRTIGAKFAADPDSELSVLSSVKDAAALDAALKGALVSSFKAQPRVIAEPTIPGGMEVSFSGGKIYFDFSTGALTGLLAAYTAPKIAAVFAEK